MKNPFRTYFERNIEKSLEKIPCNASYAVDEDGNSASAYRTTESVTVEKKFGEVRQVDDITVLNGTRTALRHIVHVQTYGEDELINVQGRIGDLNIQNLAALSFNLAGAARLLEDNRIHQ